MYCDASLNFWPVVNGGGCNPSSTIPYPGIIPNILFSLAGLAEVSTVLSASVWVWPNCVPRSSRQMKNAGRNLSSCDTNATMIFSDALGTAARFRDLPGKSLPCSVIQSLQRNLHIALPLETWELLSPLYQENAVAADKV